MYWQTTCISGLFVHCMIVNYFKTQWLNSIVCTRLVIKLYQKMCASQNMCTMHLNWETYISKLNLLYSMYIVLLCSYKLMKCVLRNISRITMYCSSVLSVYYAVLGMCIHDLLYILFSRTYNTIFRIYLYDLSYGQMKYVCFVNNNTIW